MNKIALPLALVLLISTVFAGADREIRQVEPQELRRLIEMKRVVKIAYATKEASETDEEAANRKKDEEDVAFDPGAGAGNFFANVAIADERDLLVLFAVTGAIVTVVWIASIPYSAYLALSGKEKYVYRNMLSLSYAATVFDSQEFQRNGEMTSLRYHLLFKQEDDAVDTGLALETGYYDFKDEDKYRDVKDHLNGHYWLVGPSAMVDAGSVAFKIDLLGGTSFTSEIGLIAKGDLGVLYLFSENWSAGFSFAIQYFDVKRNKGITSSGRPDYLIGPTMTYRF